MKRIVLIGAVLAALLFASTAQAQIRSHWLRVAPAGAVTTWETPQRFSSFTRLDTYRGGHLLVYWNEGCRSYASGYGLLVRFSGCGKGAQSLQVSAVNLRPIAVNVRIVYG